MAVSAKGFVHVRRRLPDSDVPCHGAVLPFGRRPTGCRPRIAQPLLSVRRVVLPCWSAKPLQCSKPRGLPCEVTVSVAFTLGLLGLVGLIAHSHCDTRTHTVFVYFRVLLFLVVDKSGMFNLDYLRRKDCEIQCIFSSYFPRCRSRAS